MLVGLADPVVRLDDLAGGVVGEAVSDTAAVLVPDTAGAGIVSVLVFVHPAAVTIVVEAAGGPFPGIVKVIGVSALATGVIVVAELTDEAIITTAVGGEGRGGAIIGVINLNELAAEIVVVIDGFSARGGGGIA